MYRFNIQDVNAYESRMTNLNTTNVSVQFVQNSELLNSLANLNTTNVSVQ